jgi:hypothetical protein
MKGILGNADKWKYIPKHKHINKNTRPKKSENNMEIEKSKDS